MSYTVVGQAQTANSTTVTYKLAEPANKRYVLVWVTSLPSPDFKIGIAEIKISG